MEDMELKARLERIERNALLAAKNVLTVKDVALLTGLSVSYIYHLTSKNKIPYYKGGGKMIYFKRSEIETWLLQSKVLTVQESKQSSERKKKGGN